MEETVTLFRLEGKYSGAGPYCSRNRALDEFPPPIVDNGSGHPSPSCCFSTRRALVDLYNRCYEAEETCYWLADIRHDSVISKLSEDFTIRFGFTSFETLGRWLGEETRQQISSNNYTISAYRVSRDCCAIGETQAVFIADCARKIGEINPLTYEFLYNNT